MKSKEDIYKAYIEDLKAKVDRSYEHSGRRASGKFGDELTTSVQSNAIKLLGAEHSQYVEWGRKRGKLPPVKAIEEWIEVKKGLPTEWKKKKEQVAFAIAKKIAREGTKGSDVFSTIIDEWLDHNLPKLTEEVGLLYIEKLEQDIIKML